MDEWMGARVGSWQRIKHNHMVVSSLVSTTIYRPLALWLADYRSVGRRTRLCRYGLRNKRTHARYAYRRLPRLDFFTVWKR